MKRRDLRTEVIKLIYQDLFSSDYDLENIESEVKEMFLGVKENLERIDEIISHCLTNWTIDRLNYVDLSIIRLATYEMILNKVPAKIIINEALEITKVYSNLDDDQAKKFNNRLLENIKNYLSEL
ncbi:MAG: transcription antitermination factor NusB [Candidatus Izemoplasmatales bacterium]